MINNINRIGCFTSSNIYKLFESKKVRETYINEKKIERKIQRSLNIWEAGKSAAWGEIVESYVFEKKLSTNYKLVSELTIKHPTIEYWSGSPDLITSTSVADIKCYEPKNFCNYADVLMSEDLELFKKKFPKEYWQLISNACIMDKEEIEAILYLPYFNELTDIQTYIYNLEMPDPFRYRFIYESDPNQLPYQIPNEFYKDLIMQKFTAPQEDKDLLTEEVFKLNKHQI